MQRQKEDRALEAKARVHREHDPPQQRDLAQALVFGILFQRDKALGADDGMAHVWRQRGGIVASHIRARHGRKLRRRFDERPPVFAITRRAKLIIRIRPVAHQRVQRLKAVLTVNVRQPPQTRMQHRLRRIREDGCRIETLPHQNTMCLVHGELCHDIDPVHGNVGHGHEPVPCLVEEGGQRARRQPGRIERIEKRHARGNVRQHRDPHLGLDRSCVGAQPPRRSARQSQRPRLALAFVGIEHAERSHMERTGIGGVAVEAGCEEAERPRREIHAAARLPERMQQ